MPIGFIFSLANLVVNLFSKFFKLFFEKPKYLVILFLIALFFPLEFIDMFLYVSINIFVVLINVLIIIFLVLINIIIDIINHIIQTVEYVIYVLSGWLLTPVNWLLDVIGKHIDPISLAPGYFDLLSYDDLTIDYFDFNIFGSGSYTGITCIFDLLGLSSPVW